MTSRSRASRSARTFLVYGTLAGAVLLALFPVLWTFSTSIKDRVDALAMPPKFFDFDPTLANYTPFFQQGAFFDALMASLWTTLGSTVLTVSIGALAAYPLARSRSFLGRRPMGLLLVAVRAMPAVVLMVPLYQIVIALGMYDQLIVVILVMTGFNLPFATWLMVSYIKQIPFELDEAARIDGASSLGVFRRVIAPLSAPGLAATTIFVAMISWNEFLIPLVLGAKTAQTLPVFISGFIQQRVINWGALAAGATIAILPITIFTILIQRQLVKGLGLGAVKA